MTNQIKPIAIYLPQFHPIPENDLWWGKGFTEWTNVCKATPRFKGHYQPHLPSDLGFYDLRLEETRLAQESLAKEYGIHGFCYYHYWFNSKKMLQEPIERKLKNPKEDFPFMLCWANENWTRAWDGQDKEVLMFQDYNEEDDIKHMNYLCDTFFKDSRYIRHDGKPVFIVYRPKLFKNINKTLENWRSIARQKGIGDLHLGYMQSFDFTEDPHVLGFDFAVEFQPKFDLNPRSTNELINLYFKLKRKLKTRKKRNDEDKIIDFKKFTETQIKNNFKTNVSPALTPMWDNSARRKKNAYIFTNSTPEIYGNWLSHIVKNYPWSKNKEKFLFINAWNEWAEGNHLEPCQKWGLQYLEATKKILNNKLQIINHPNI